MTSWTPQEVARMTSLLKDGRSYSEISAILMREMGVHYTRNACIGKAARLGLEAPAKPSKPAIAPVYRKPTKPRTVAAGRPSRAKITQPSGVGAFVLPELGTGGGGLEKTVEAAKANAAAKAASLTFAATMNADPPGQRTMETLCAHECRWPIGDPQHRAFSFCGVEHDLAGSYCHKHARRAYQPAPARKRLGHQIGINRLRSA
jgi:GcrA cell cycle regulator